MKRFFSVTLAAFMTLSLSGCVEYLDEPNESFASTVSISETTETTPQTTETELTETTTVAETKLTETTTTVTETEQTETTRETAVPAELDGDYLQWAQTAADTVYRFLKEKICYPNSIYKFGFVDLTFDGVPEIIIEEMDWYNGSMAAYTINGDFLYYYGTVNEYEIYTASVDTETGEKVMLYEAGGGGCKFSKVVFVFTPTDVVISFHERLEYNYNNEISLHEATIYIDDLIEKSDDCDGLYQKYFGKYEELYRFNYKTEIIDLPDSENYSLDDVYACVSQMMKKYSENLPQN